MPGLRVSYQDLEETDRRHQDATVFHSEPLAGAQCLHGRDAIGQGQPALTDRQWLREPLIEMVRRQKGRLAAQGI